MPIRDMITKIIQRVENKESERYTNNIMNPELPELIKRLEQESEPTIFEDDFNVYKIWRWKDSKDEFTVAKILKGTSYCELFIVRAGV